MAFTRGVKEDYDSWAELGNPGWSYKEVLPYFKKLENCTLDYRDELYRGFRGPISVEKPYLTVGDETFVEAAENLGYRYVDFNGRTNKGVSYTQSNLKNGLR